MPNVKTPAPIQRLERGAVPDLSTLTIGGHTVRRTRLHGTPYTVYSTMVGDEVAGRQISYPEESDCQRHVRAHASITVEGRQRVAMLDTDLHNRIVGILKNKEMDARDLCRMFAKTSAVMGPVLAMLTTERRISKTGTPRRPIYSVPLAAA